MEHNESRETLLPRPVLFNAALYSAIALVYSVSFFIIDRIGPDKYVFETRSSLRKVFSYVAICSWAVLLFGGLILVAVRVGANVQRRRRRRSRRKSRQKRLARESANDPNAAVDDSGQIDAGTHRSRSRPATPSGGGVAVGNHNNGEPSPSVSLTGSLAGSSSASRTASPSPNGKRVASSGNDKHGDGGGGEKKKRSKGHGKKSKDNSAHSSSSRSVPVGFVSVTTAQKVYAAIGFAWVAAGLAATAAAAALVFFGQRERLENAISALGLESDSDERWKEWVIPICTGGIFMVLFALLALTTLSKVVLTALAQPREVDPLPPPAAGNDSEYEGGTLFDRDAVLPRGADQFEDAEVDLEKGMTPNSLSRGVIEHDVYGMMGEGVPGSSSGTWRQFTKERRLPFQPDDATIDRMMRQLRDMGFTNPHQNIAALQASCFDLEKASDKLTNTQVE